MSRLTDYLFRLSVVLVLFGGAFLVWYYYIDGVYVRKPIVFMRGVDPMNLQLEKTVYTPGELVRYKTAFCKSRQATATVLWSLANDVLTIFPPREGQGVPVGCYPTQSDFILADIQMIPPNAREGCSHYFLGQVTRDYGGGRTEVQNFRTETFCIVVPQS